MSDDELKAVAARICAARGFTLGATLGAGAFKETYLAIAADGQQFALKVVRASADPARIEREVEAMARCSHSNISTLQDFGLEQTDHRTYCWLLEEYLAGGTLAEKLHAEPMVPIASVVRLGTVVIDALAYLRSLGIVHRDIKPQNILFRADGMTPVLVDFGIARDLSQESLTQTWAMRGPGTPFYAAPEQLHNSKDLIDWRVDQFSLGVMLTVCGFGRHPFAEPNEPMELTVHKVSERRRASEGFAAWAGANGLSALVRMVAPWPVERFRTPELLRQQWPKSEE